MHLAKASSRVCPECECAHSKSNPSSEGTERRDRLRPMRAGLGVLATSLRNAKGFPGCLGVAAGAK